MSQRGSLLLYISRRRSDLYTEATMFRDGSDHAGDGHDMYSTERVKYIQVREKNSYKYGSRNILKGP